MEGATNMKKQTYPHIGETLYFDQLENGLTVFLLPKREMAKTYGIFSTNYGSIDQTFTPIGQQDQITVPEGIAHFLEHKLFEKEDYDVFQDFSKHGASANAYTSFTKTAYLFAATNHIATNVKTLLDFVQDPYFSKQSVDKEKGIIAQEIQMYNDQPEWRAIMGTIQAMFHHHPVKVDIAATVESIQQITKDDLYTCYETFYHPENMILFIAGNFEPEKMIELIRSNQEAKHFEPMTSIDRHYPEEPAEVTVKEHHITMPVSTPKCTIGIKESSSQLERDEFLKKDLLQSMILTYYFSKGGPFYHILYDENLIDDSFYFETTLDKNFGYSMIGSNTNHPDRLGEKVKQLLLSTQTASISQEDVERMKKKKIGQLLREMNSLEVIANQSIHYHTFGIDFFELIPAIKSLTKEDVQHLLSEWITEDRLAVCKVVPE